MELQEFIKETLVQITNGVKEAQEELKDKGSVIVPNGYLNPEAQYQDKSSLDFRSVQIIKMHIALNVQETSGSKAQLGVAKILKAGIDSDESTSNQQLTTVEFEIPIALPVMDKDN